MAEENKDLKQKVRTVTRRHFTKSANAFEILLSSSIIDQSKNDELQASYKVLKEIYIELHKYDDQIKEILISDESFDEDKFEKELAEVDKYKTRWSRLETIYLSHNTNGDFEKKMHKIKLPILEIKKMAVLKTG